MRHAARFKSGARIARRRVAEILRAMMPRHRARSGASGRNQSSRKNGTHPGDRAGNHPGAMRGNRASGCTDELSSGCAGSYLSFMPGLSA